MVLSKDEVEGLRLRNPMQKGSPTGAWKTDYPAMACAKAIKQLSKYMPLSDAMHQAVATDEKIITENAFTNNHEGIDADLMTDPEDVFEDAEVDNDTKETTESPESTKDQTIMFNSKKEDK